MKLWLFICLVLLIPDELNATEVDIIPKNIDFVSTKWIDQKGTFRIISYNSEDRPCFILQNYKEGLIEKLTSSNMICSVKIPNNIVINVNDDQSGGTWFENFEWSESELLFILDSADGKFNCKINLYKPIKQLGQCTKI